MELPEILAIQWSLLAVNSEIWLDSAGITRNSAHLKKEVAKCQQIEIIANLIISVITKIMIKLITP